MKWMLMALMVGLIGCTTNPSGVDSIANSVPESALQDNPSPVSEEGSSPSSTSTPVATSRQISSENTLKMVNIEVATAYYWRDWMPGVDKPGADGGSPLLATLDVKFENLTAQETLLTLENAELQASDQSPIAISFQSRRQDGTTPWNGVLAANNKAETITFFLDDGPYLAVGTEVEVMLEFSDQAGGAYQVNVPAQAIEKTF